MELSERYLKQLEAEGFTHVYEWFGDPDAELTLPTNAVALVTEGALLAAASETSDVGSRVKEGVYRAGKHGCKVVIGEY